MAKKAKLNNFVLPLVIITLSLASCEWFAASKISKDVLDEFEKVSDSLEAGLNAQQALEESEEFVQEVNRIRQELGLDSRLAMELSDDFVAYVDTLREYIISESGGYDSANTLKGKRNVAVPTRILLEEGKGRELKARIEQLREDLLSMPGLDSLDRDTLAAQFTLSTEYNIEAARKLGKKSWEAYLFDHVPVIAINTMLTKIQGDAKHSAGLVIESLVRKTKPQDKAAQ